MGLLGLVGCVPKTQYDDQQVKLREAQAALRQLEQNTLECNPNTLLELREQTQSLDILTQELLNRNTELSEEVARLRVYESQVKNQSFSCDKRLAQAQEENEAKLARTRKTYEDLVADLRKQISQLEAELKLLKSQSAKEEPTGGTSPEKK